MGEVQERMAREDGIAPKLYAGMTVDQIEAHRRWVKRCKAELAEKRQLEDLEARRQLGMDKLFGIERYHGNVGAITGEGFRAVSIESDEHHAAVVIPADEMEDFGNWLVAMARKQRAWRDAHDRMISPSTGIRPGEELDQ